MVGRGLQGVAGDVSTDIFGSGGAAVATRDSVLILDTDRHAVRALLFDLVDSAPRFVGEGSSRTMSVGDALGHDRLWEAIHALERETGRQLSEGEQILTPQHANGDGVDEVFLTGLPVVPNKAALISIGSGALGKQLVRGIRQSPTIVASAEEDLGLSSTFSITTLHAWLRDLAPKTLILVHDGGVAEDWDIVVEAAADAARDGAITNGIVIADDAKQQLVAQSLGGVLELSGIDPVDYEPWEIASALESEFVEQYKERVQESDGFAAVGSVRYVDRLRSIQSVASFLHRRMHRNVVSLTIGDGALVYHVSEAGGATSFRGEQDLALGSRSLLRISPERVTRWLPQRWSAEELTEWILNRSLRPFGRPDSTTDSLVEAAVRREFVTDLVNEAGLGQNANVDLVVVGPNFIGQDLGLAVLTIIDGIAPQSADGVVTIALDAEGLMAPIGAISTIDPVFARDVIEQDFLVPMATCVVVSGDGERGALAVRGEVKVSGGESRRFSVPFGNLHLLAVDESEGAEVTLTPEPGFHVGGHQPGEVVEFTGDRTLFGGRVGIVIDARGRPINLPEDPESRAALLRAWLTDMGSVAD
ncbi:MAG TPA: hypothetical protein VNE17_05580 [Nitrolancea sp.]|nr:hypothetical protein [Nitrolancea sp.]